MGAVAQGAFKSKGLAAIELELVDFWASPKVDRPVAPIVLRDIWDVELSAEKPLARGEESGTSGFVDFWGEINASFSTDEAAPNLDYPESEQLPWFEPKASENPFVVARPPRGDVLAQRRARWLVGLLDVPEQRRRERLKGYFVGLFSGPEPVATFGPLASLAVDGVSADIVVAACEFRQHWEQTPRLRYRRSRYERGIFEVSSQQLSWPRAARICELCDAVPPETVIEETWFYQWLDLPHGDVLYWSFLDFVESRLALRARGYWEPSDPWERRVLSADRQHEWGIIPLGSYSRTGEMIRGHFDQIGPPDESTD